MPTPRTELRRIGPSAALGLVALAALVTLGGTQTLGASQATRGSWRGLVGGERLQQVALGQRMIVVLKAPSLAERVAAAGGIASERDQRRWTSAAYASQQQLLSTLSQKGIGIRPEVSFARVINGFATPLDPRAIAVIEHSPEVKGVFAVRAAYPASVSSALLKGSEFRPGRGHRPDMGLPGYDGRGVTIALLDTGVDRAQPYLRGRIAPGIDIVGNNDHAGAESSPVDAGRLERHGTEMAGILVGAGGPSGLSGVATGATVLPIRVAGWQQDAQGGWSVYARSDQIVAGLDRAVDPNGDGAANDAARIALVALAEPYAAFADSPEALAVAGALDLDTLVVTPAGNDGPAGPGFGSVSGPGGAPASLTVGAVDMRLRNDEARVVLRRGLDVQFDRDAPLLGAVSPDAPLSLEVAAPRTSAPDPHAQPGDRPPSQLIDFFDRRGFSLVAGRAALVPAGDAPEQAVEAAAGAGAAAVVLYGDPLPAGSIGVNEAVRIPVVSVPAAPALALLSAQRAGADVQLSIGSGHSAPNGGLLRVAAFSSRGLAFDGRVKPELVAPGVALATSEPGANEDGSPRFGTANGSSVAAATVAGAAALLAQARPNVDSPALKSLLVGYARPLAGEPLTAQGGGLADVGAAAAGEVVAAPTALGFGTWTGKSWTAKRTLVVRNVSSRRLRLGITARPEGGESELLAFSIDPSRVVVRAGRSQRVVVTVHLAGRPTGDLASGVISVAPDGGVALRIPWAIGLHAESTGLLTRVALSTRSFAPSDTAPARLVFQAGRLVHRAGIQVVPVARLDVQLLRADGTAVGLLARLRDLLPGHYAFGLTGRDPAGARLPPGDYRLRLVAFPTLPGRPTRASVDFAIN